MEFTNLDINSLYPHTVDITNHIINDRFELLTVNTRTYQYGIKISGLHTVMYVKWCEDQFKEKCMRGQEDWFSTTVWFKEEAHRNWFLLRWQP